MGEFKARRHIHAFCGYACHGPRLLQTGRRSDGKLPINVLQHIMAGRRAGRAGSRVPRVGRLPALLVGRSPLRPQLFSSGGDDCDSGRPCVPAVAARALLAMGSAQRGDHWYPWAVHLSERRGHHVQLCHHLDGDHLDLVSRHALLDRALLGLCAHYNVGSGLRRCEPSDE